VLHECIGGLAESLQRDGEPGLGLVAEGDDAPGVEVDVATPERRRFRLAESCPAHELQEVRRPVRTVSVEGLRAHAGDDSP
jgi:hypothetical protein